MQYECKQCLWRGPAEHLIDGCCPTCYSDDIIRIEEDEEDDS
jgi:hypothetical protein